MDCITHLSYIYPPVILANFLSVLLIHVHVLPIQSQSEDGDVTHTNTQL